MTIRRLDTADAPALRALWADGLQRLPAAFLLTKAELLAVPDDSFAQSIPAQLCFGAFEGEQLVGFVIARQSGVARLSHTADIGPLFVHPSAQGQGLGQTLMTQVVTELTAMGLLQAELSVDAANDAAIALYQKLGFSIFGRRPRSVLIDGEPRNDLLMILALDGADLGTGA